ncbi:MAG: phosphoserine phosphatase SerB [Streptococcaceae bacterium]|jgi:phosphoserine phosphatase|nr:phosphoserine phosphatase SerB [Streptococcaceae bacterium]
MTQKLLVMDVDSTLIEEEVIDLLGEEAGVGDEIAAVTAAAMRGELDFREALKERVAKLAGLPDSIFSDVYQKVHLTHGARELVEGAHLRDWKVGVVSGGFHEIVDLIATDLGLDFVLANRLGVVDGVLTGNTVGDVVTKELKLETLKQWARKCDLEMKDTIAMGDGANDIPMILAAGFGIAFCAKPVVVEAAPFAINVRDLTKVFDSVDKEK